MNRVTHFEVPADDTDRAAKFYTEAFGWGIHHWDGDVPFWLETSGENDPGINGVIIKRDSVMPVITTITTDDIEATIKRVIAAGGKKDGEITMSGKARYIYMHDTENNVFGVTEPID